MDIHGGWLESEQIQMSNIPLFHVIYTESEMYLSNRNWKDWREIQDFYDTYKASLGPWPFDEMLQYLEFEYLQAWQGKDQTWKGFLEGLLEDSEQSCRAVPETH